MLYGCAALTAGDISEVPTNDTLQVAVVTNITVGYALQHKITVLKT